MEKKKNKIYTKSSKIIKEDNKKYKGKGIAAKESNKKAFSGNAKKPVDEALKKAKTKNKSDKSESKLKSEPDKVQKNNTNNRLKKEDNNVFSKNNSKKNYVFRKNRNISIKGENKKVKSICPISKRCGACDYIDMDYNEQLKLKQKYVEKLLNPYGRVENIVPMQEPYFYRNKVSAVFGYENKKIIAGIYEKNSHNIVDVEKCMIEDELATQIVNEIKRLCMSFKIKAYDEDRQTGILRHVLIRVGKASKEIMLVLVTSGVIFPHSKNFVKAVREKFPQINTVIQNINDKSTSMVLGEREKVLYGRGYIEDILCGIRFRISPKSFYQINHSQTESLYSKAIELADIDSSQVVLDAYCGIGTIGMVASKSAKKVIGVELNADAVKDAVANARINDIKNIEFFNADVGDFITALAENKEKIDVLIMDPPRAGSSEKFIDCIKILAPKSVVYISCNPETLERDLKYFSKKGYKMQVAYPFDCFSHTKHVEVVVKLFRKNTAAYFNLKIDKRA